MIYYQTEGGPVISDKVSGGERETHSLDRLQRGVTYYISILALSQHLPSPLVGPVSVDTGLILRFIYLGIITLSLAGNTSEFVNTSLPILRAVSLKLRFMEGVSLQSLFLPLLPHLS